MKPLSEMTNEEILEEVRALRERRAQARYKPVSIAKKKRGEDTLENILGMSEDEMMAKLREQGMVIEDENDDNLDSK